MKRHRKKLKIYDEKIELRFINSIILQYEWMMH